MKKNKPSNYFLNNNTLFYIHCFKCFSVRRQIKKESDECAYGMDSYSITRRSSSINLLLVAGSISCRSAARPCGKAFRSAGELPIFDN